MVVRPSSGAGNAETGKTANTAQNDSELLLDDPVKYVQDYTKKKIRNLEKRKSKLDGYKAKMNKGETLSKDQQEAVNKFGEVSGMLTFASELVSHVASVDAGAKKERKKCARKEQLKAEADKLELVTKALEVFTLMHLTEPDDKIATPLRKRCSFTPTPGAHLDQFCADTAKLLISLIDEEKLNQDLLIDDEQGIVKYSDIKEKLEEIRPKFNPVPDYVDDGSDYIAEEIESEKSVGEDAEEIEELEVVSSEGFENGIETENSSPVQINGIETVENGNEQDAGSPEEGFVSIQHVEPDPVPIIEPEIEMSHPEAGIEYQPEPVQPQPVPVQEEMVQIPTTMEFVNREVFGDEDKIKEILTEVSSGFNFLAPADDSEFDMDQNELQNDLGLNFTGHPVSNQIPTQAPIEETETAHETQISAPVTTGLEPVLDVGGAPVETVSFDNPNLSDAAYEGYKEQNNKEHLKDEPTWQQRQVQAGQGQARQVYRSTGNTNTSYRNSQRYQRNFENRRPAGQHQNGAGDNGHSQRNGHSKAPRTGGRGENGQYHKRAAYDNRGHSRGGGSKA